jgi:hypothetical protein
VLDGIVELYGGNQEVQPLVEEALQRIDSLRGASAPAGDQADREPAAAPVGEAGNDSSG